jgi:hypothetical protein
MTGLSCHAHAHECSSNVKLCCRLLSCRFYTLSAHRPDDMLCLLWDFPETPVQTKEICESSAVIAATSLACGG